MQFLIVGMARSGTTVAQRLASELDSVWVPPETHFWRHAEALAKGFQMPLSRERAKEAMLAFLALESSSGLEVDVNQLTSLAEDNYLWDLFEALVVALSPSEASFLGEKTPDHARWAMQLLDAVPHLKVIGLIRDPREVFRSHGSVQWGIRDPLAFSEKWVEHARILNDLTALFPERALVLRYEDVAAEPDAARARMAELIGEGVPGMELSVSAKNLDEMFLPSEPWKTKALEPIVVEEKKWPTVLSSEDVSTIESRAAFEMTQHEYELSGAARSRRGGQVAQAMSMRRSGASAALSPLPITERDLDAWDHSLAAREARWRSRSAAAEEKLSDLRAQLSDQEKLRRELEEAHGNLSHLTDKVEKSAAEIVRLRQWLTAEKVLSLKRRKELMRASAKLKRLRARRWWALGRAIRNWTRSPLRVDRLIRELAALTQRTELPPMPDTSSIDSELAELARSGKPQSREGGTLSEARSSLEAGDYEACLSLLSALHRQTRESCLLERDCYVRLGEISKALRALRAAMRLGPDDPSLRLQARILSGRLTETNPSWLPSLPEWPTPRTLPQEGVVAHLLKESLPYYERGYTLRSRATLESQMQLGLKPVVITSLGFPREQGFDDFALVEEVDGVVHHRLDMGDSYRTKTIPPDQVLSDFATLALKAAQRARPMLIQAGSGYRGFDTALVGLALAERLGIPLIYEVRSFLEHTWTGEINRSEQGEYYRRRLSQELRCMGDASLVITIAETMKSELVRRGGDPEKIMVVPNVVDVARFTPRPKPRILMSRLGLSGKAVLGYISNLGQREGVELLVEAVGLMRAEGKDVAGLIVGDGPHRDAVEHRIHELGLESHCVMTGHVSNSQIEDYYALIDVFAVPRIYDRASRFVTPLKPVEAMAMGCPIVVSDLPALQEIVEPGVRGLVFKRGDAASLAERASWLLDHGQSASELSRNARKWVVDERTVEANAARYKVVLDRLGL
ncbi:MAG: glycosyltransferase [Acidimicrobiia bacterium]|nr:glycosyltransferase [Acidimicrobiia bacterium]